VPRWENKKLEIPHGDKLALFSFAFSCDLPFFRDWHLHIYFLLENYIVGVKGDKGGQNILPHVISSQYWTQM